MSDETRVEIPSTEVRKGKQARPPQYRRRKINNLLAGIVAAVLAALAVTKLLPVLGISGDGMAPTLRAGDLVVTAAAGQVTAGDIIAFYYHDKILVKRVVGCPGDWIRIDEEGTVYVNAMVLDETYISEKALGTADVEFPYEVPQGRYFVMGDCRRISADSRNSAVGCVAQEQIIGIVRFRIWPLGNFGAVA